MRYNLVFEGGGAKGLVFVGALLEFESRGHTFGRVLGTSAGAITATLLAAGYNAPELLAATNEKLPDGSPRFASFMDIPPRFDEQFIFESLSFALLRQIDLPLIIEPIEQHLDRKLIEWLMGSPVYRQVFSFVERGGLYAGDEFLKWMREKLEAKGENLGEATLSEFNVRTGKDLTVVASDTTGEQILVLNHRTAPDCPVVYATRMSMSVPFVWQEILWQESWGLYRGQDISGHTVVDGGVLSNFPIELLISRRKEVLDLMGPHDGVFALGFLIDEELPVQESEPVESGGKDRSKPIGIDLQQLALVKRVTGLVNTITRSRDKQVIEEYADGVCRLPAKGYGTTEFDMSDERMTALIDAGRAAAHDFFEEFESL